VISGAMADGNLMGGGDATAGVISNLGRPCGVVDSTLRSEFSKATTLPLYVSRGDRAVLLWTDTLSARRSYFVCGLAHEPAAWSCR